MPFYKWRAYDYDSNYKDGVMEATDYEQVAKIIGYSKLIPIEVKEITYKEYQSALKVEKLKNKLIANKNMLDKRYRPKPIFIEPSYIDNRLNINKYLIPTIVIVGLLILLILS